jgi:hypothetical protein
LSFNPPLLCTSSWRFEICLPSLYILIEFSPNDQNTLKLFVSIKRTNIYISSYKCVLNRSIPMEVRFDTFPLSPLLNNFPFQFLIFSRIFLVARYCAHSKNSHQSGTFPEWVELCSIPPWDKICVILTRCKSLLDSSKLVQIFLPCSSFCRKLTRCFVSEKYIRAHPIMLIAPKLLSFGPQIYSNSNLNLVKVQIQKPVT